MIKALLRNYFFKHDCGYMIVGYNWDKFIFQVLPANVSFHVMLLPAWPRMARFHYDMKTSCATHLCSSYLPRQLCHVQNADKFVRRRRNIRNSCQLQKRVIAAWCINNNFRIESYLGFFVCDGNPRTPSNESPVYRFRTNLATRNSPAKSNPMLEKS